MNYDEMLSAALAKMNTNSAYGKYAGGAGLSKEELHSRAVKNINEVLLEDDYPEFDTILEYYLANHPEYKL